jgi:hypothetical protein
MKKIITFFTLLTLLSGCKSYNSSMLLDGTSIYKGKYMGFHVYYDDRKEDVFIEYGMGKFAGIEFLTKDTINMSSGIIAYNEHSRLVKKGDKLFYASDRQNIRTRLRKHSISVEDNAIRKDIFQIKYFYTFSDWPSDDFLFKYYRDSVMTHMDFMRIRDFK